LRRGKKVAGVEKEITDQHFRMATVQNDAMQNQRRQGTAPSCGLARTETNGNVNSDGCTGQRDYSYHCEDADNVRSRPQGSVGKFVVSGNFTTYEMAEKYALHIMIMAVLGKK